MVRNLSQCGKVCLYGFFVRIRSESEEDIRKPAALLMCSLKRYAGGRLTRSAGYLFKCPQRR